MDFSFSGDQQLLRSAARSFLETHCTPALVRSLMDDPRGESEAIWKELAQLGWLGLGLPEKFGGSDLGMVETACVLEEMGRVAYPGPYAPTVLAARAILEAASEQQKERWLPSIAGGGARATVAFLDAELDWDPSSIATTATRTSAGFTLSGVKQFVPWAHVADVMVIPARVADGGGDAVRPFLVERATAGLRVSPVTGIDLGTRWARVELDTVRVPADGALAASGGARPLIDRLLLRAAVAAAAEMLGAARRCLDLSVSYVKVREQFGQPIGAFQAIRHACAEMLLEVENAHAATYYAAWALDAGAEDADVAASIAKAYVGDAARRVCGDAIQVHGGIGFTWEYDLHLYFKRAKALEAMYGDADHHRELIVRAVAG